MKPFFPLVGAASRVAPLDLRQVTPKVAANDSNGRAPTRPKIEVTARRSPVA